MKKSAAVIALVLGANVAFAGVMDGAVQAAGKVAVEIIKAKKTNVTGTTVENSTKMTGGDQKARGAFNTINNGVSFKGANVKSTKVKNKTELKNVKQNIDGFANNVNNGVTF